jgi:hypothetical protein
MPDVEEIVLHVEVGVNLHVGLTQGHKGSNVQNPRRGQIVQL